MIVGGVNGNPAGGAAGNAGSALPPNLKDVVKSVLTGCVTDVDRPGELGPALRDARRLCGAILDRYRELDDDDLLIFLSGGKGMHVGLPTSPWRPEPSPGFHDSAKRFALAQGKRREFSDRRHGVPPV